MGADFSDTDLEWATNKDTKLMDTKDQWINLCVMSSSQNSVSIDAMIEDMMDEQRFHGMTGVEDLFDEAQIDPIKSDSTMFCLKTSISLHSDCATWDQVVEKLGEHENSIAVCMIAVNNEELFVEAQRLMSEKPTAPGKQLFPVFVRNAKADSQQLDARVSYLANEHNGMMVSAKHNHPSAPLMYKYVLKRLAERTLG